MSSTILEFIKVFQSEFTEDLFKNCACYWFSQILHQRFPRSSIVYNPHIVHFATRIDSKVYDIAGIVEDESDYVDWDEYKESASDAYDIIAECIYLKGGDRY